MELGGAVLVDPEQVTAVNGLSVLGLLEQVKHLRDTEGYDPRICQASSSEMFGLVTELPQTEGSPHHPAARMRCRRASPTTRR